MRAFTRLRTLTIISLVTVALTTAACSQGSDATPDSTTLTLGAPTASPTPEGWRAKYSADQLDEYEDALRRLEEYEELSEPFWAEGAVTPAAEGLFEDYWVTWRAQKSRLELYEESGWTVTGTAEVLSSRATRITDNDGLVEVVVQQCIDPTPIRVLPEPADPKPGNGRRTEPYIRTVTAMRTGTDPFKLLAVLDLTNTTKVKPCDS